MPKNSIPSRLYDVGSYGPFEINNITNANTDWVELTLTVEDWPDISPVAVGQIRWSNGDGADFAMNGVQRNRDGTVQTTRSVRVGVPQRANGKAAVGSVSVSMDVLAPIRTAVTLTSG